MPATGTILIKPLLTPCKLVDKGVFHLGEKHLTYATIAMSVSYTTQKFGTRYVHEKAPRHLCPRYV